MKAHFTLVSSVLILLGLTGCGATATQNGSVSNTPTSASRQTEATRLSVLYAGSMTNVMENKIRQDANARLHIDVQGEGKGSQALAQMIRGGISQPDIFISASPAVDQSTLMGPANHNLVTWYIPFAQDQLVIAYSPKSRFATQLERSAQGQVPWYQVLASTGFRLGRTDPALDPKGASTIFLFQLASTYYHQPGLATNILGANNNPNQVFPEETLLAQLTSGQVDAIVAYKHEAVEWGVPYITLPKQVNLGDASLAKQYAKASIQTSSGKIEKGAPIVFTITIPSTTAHEKQAELFVKYIVSGQGHTILMRDGFTPIAPQVSGQKKSLPSDLQNLVRGTLS